MTALETGSKENSCRLECADSLPNIGIPDGDSKDCDYVPKEVLFALTRVTSPKQLEPTKRPTDLEALALPGRKRPCNVWHHKRREKLKHLTDETMCICGAGRDISFLYDVPKSDRKLEKLGLTKGKIEKKDPKSVQLPSTLIPEEFHLVKNQGTKNLEFKDEEYKTYLEEHEKHLVQFPSLKPNSRYEVVQLRNTMIDMLDKAGINDVEIEVKGPTQIHNLLELIKKEQSIYNVIFHELIRQVSVDCIERGDLLAEIRKRYSDLLNRVPNQVKSLHQEVIAQRALDRRLTEELFSFKNALNTLTAELAKVKEHDSQLASEVDSTRKALKIALSEAAKNSNILTEYHELYELQRRRLENQVSAQVKEKEMWCTTTYSLAIKVIEECNLTTAKRLLVSEKTWAKIVQHCAVLISDQDTVLLAKIQELVINWKDSMEKFYLDISQWEETSRVTHDRLKVDIELNFENFKDQILNETGSKICPPTSVQREIYDTMYRWDEIITAESQNYDGIISLSRLEELAKMMKLQGSWEELSRILLDRHKPSDNQVNMLRTSTDHLNVVIKQMKYQYEILLTGENGASNALLLMSHRLSHWLPKLNASILGRRELNTKDLDEFFDLEHEMLTQMDKLIECFGMPNTVEARKETGLGLESRVSAFEVMHAGEHWFTVTCNVIDSQDAKLVEYVNSLHLEIVMWTCNILLRLCPDHPSSMQEAKEALYATCPTPAKLLEEFKLMLPRVKEISEKITRDLANVNQMVAYFGYDNKIPFGSSVKIIEQGYGDGSTDMQRMTGELAKWTETAQLLISQVLKKPVLKIFPDSEQTNIDCVRAATKEKTHMEQFVQSQSEFSVPDICKEKVEVVVTKAEEISKRVPKEEIPSISGEKEIDTLSSSREERYGESCEDKSPVYEEEEDVEEEEAEDGGLSANTPPEEDSDEQLAIALAEPKEKVKSPALVVHETKNIPDMMQIVGDDGNTHPQKLEYDRDYVPDSESDFVIEDIPNIKRAYVALASVKKLQKLLIVTEERAQMFETRSEKAEKELIDCEERIRELEKLLRDCNRDPELNRYLSADKSAPTPESSLKAPKPPKTGKKSPMRTVKAKKK